MAPFDKNRLRCNLGVVRFVSWWLLLGGGYGGVYFVWVLLLRVFKSSSLGDATATISPPRLIVVVESPLRLGGVRLFLGTTKPEKRGAVAILE